VIFTPTKIPGAYIVDVERKEDARGFNARSWDMKEFTKLGLLDRIAQTNILYNGTAGTLRGMHYQAPPRAENKLFRCVRGAVFDAVIDMRPDSGAYLEWITVELTAENYRQLHIPEGCAQGFQTLEDDTELAYQVSEFYSPEFERGIRYDDPAFGIPWPMKPTVISDKDKNWPDLAVPPRHPSMDPR
jgi:dTDP-4-dehydrorhamnose 3,5-epimerase